MTAPHEDPAAVVREACERLEAGLRISSLAGRAADAEWHDMPARAVELEREVEAIEASLRAALERLRGLRVVEGWTVRYPNTGVCAGFYDAADFRPSPGSLCVSAALLLPPEGS